MKKLAKFALLGFVALLFTACGVEVGNSMSQQYHLGLVIENEKNKCNQGYANACKGLGALYLNQNSDVAKYYFGLACNMGDSESCEFYNRIQN